jgi:hypothetical protein
VVAAARASNLRLGSGRRAVPGAGRHVAHQRVAVRRSDRPGAEPAHLGESLTAALAEPATTTYPGDDHCDAGNQWCADAILQSPLGGIEHDLIAWQNRPTYQQVVSFPARRGFSLWEVEAYCH